MMKISHTEKFNSREELDSFVRSRFGEKNKGRQLELEVSEEEAQTLGLSESTTVYEGNVKIKKSNKPA